MTDPFDTATYYEALDNEEFGHVTVSDALEAAINHAWECDDDTTDSLIAKIAPVVVTAWARKTVTGEHVKSLMLHAFDSVEENADELFGNPERFDTLWTDDETAEIRAALSKVVRRAMDRASIWQCDVVGKRSYTADEISAMLTGEQT